VAFALEPLSSPLAVLPAAWWWGGAPLAALAYGVVVLLRDGAGWWRLRGPYGVVDTAGDLAAARAGHAGVVG
jgi:hypothetical protein